MKISPDILINKNCHSHQWFLASRHEESSQHCDPEDTAIPHGDCWGAGGCKKQGEEETGVGPDSWGAYKRHEFSEPGGLHLPTQRMLNSLTCYLIFDVHTACSLCCKLVYSLASPPASLEQFSQSYWNVVSWAVSPKHSHQIK